MPHRVAFAPEARDDLAALHRFIETDSGSLRAGEFLESIISYCEGFATFPLRGRSRDEIRPGLRTVGFRRRVTIAFAVDAESVTILGVFHADRDIERTLESDDD